MISAKTVAGVTATSVGSSRIRTNSCCVMSATWPTTSTVWILLWLPSLKTRTGQYIPSIQPDHISRCLKLDEKITLKNYGVKCLNFSTTNIPLTVDNISGIVQVAVTTPVKLFWQERSWRRARKKPRWPQLVPLARETGARWRERFSFCLSFIYSRRLLSYCKDPLWSRLF